MKKAIIGVIAAIGGVGIIALMRFHPAAAGTINVASSTPTTDTSTTPAVDTTSTTPATTTGAYKDGSYTGTAVQNEYGAVQVKAVISGAKITDVVFLQLPNDQQHSVEVSAMAKPQLKQETLTAQSARVDIVSGATSTSQSYAQSLQAALNAAKA